MKKSFSTVDGKTYYRGRRVSYLLSRDDIYRTWAYLKPTDKHCWRWSVRQIMDVVDLGLFSEALMMSGRREVVVGKVLERPPDIASLNEMERVAETVDKFFANELSFNELSRLHGDIEFAFSDFDRKVLQVMSRDVRFSDEIFEEKLKMKADSECHTTISTL